MKFKEIAKELSIPELRERVKDYQQRILEDKETIRMAKKRIKILKQEEKSRYETGK
jgi:hypothetical protein